MKPARHILEYYDPVISFIPSTSDLTGLLFEKHKNTLFENNIQIVYQYYEAWGFSANFHLHEYWKTYDCFDFSAVPRDILPKDELGLLDFFEGQILQGRYLWMSINTRYIEHYESYGQVDRPHPIFVYGYDSALQKFMCVDFFDFSEPSRKEVSYEQFARAYFEYAASKVLFAGEINPNFDSLIMVSEKEVGARLFNKNRALYAFHSLLTYTNSGTYPKYGLSVFDDFSEMLVDEKYVKQSIYSAKGTAHFLCEHVHMMQLRYNFFCEEGLVRHAAGIEDELYNIHTALLQMRNMIIKLYLDKRSDVVAAQLGELSTGYKDIGYRYRRALECIRGLLMG